MDFPVSSPDADLEFEMESTMRAITTVSPLFECYRKKTPNFLLFYDSKHLMVNYVGVDNFCDSVLDDNDDIENVGVYGCGTDLSNVERQHLTHPYAQIQFRPPTINTHRFLTKERVLEELNKALTICEPFHGAFRIERLYFRLRFIHTSSKTGEHCHTSMTDNQILFEPSKDGDIHDVLSKDFNRRVRQGITAHYSKVDRLRFDTSALLGYVMWIFFTERPVIKHS